MHKIDADLVLYGLAGGFLISEGKEFGLRTASEVFADRTYQPDGSLTPRSEPNALIDNTEGAISQVLQMVTSMTVTAVNGATVPVQADTICIHGDGKHAVEFAKKIRDTLDEKGIAVRCL